MLQGPPPASALLIAITHSTGLPPHSAEIAIPVDPFLGRCTSTNLVSPGDDAAQALVKYLEDMVLERPKIDLVQMLLDVNRGDR